MQRFSIVDSKRTAKTLDLIFDSDATICSDRFVINLEIPEMPKKMRQTKVSYAPDLSKNALTVLERRYLVKNETGEIMESPEQMFRRVAKCIASADKFYHEKADLELIEEEFYQAMARLEFLPNSPTLMNAGRKLGQLSACFVLPVEDSMDSIFETIKHTALIHKSGGGTGFSFSRIRPTGDIVQSTKGVSSGPISFMNVFDAATEAIKQGGTRRGANMAILRVDHPDIKDFIACKTDHHKLNNFNISVSITDRFMQALEKDEMYELINPRTRQVTGHLKASEVFDSIVHRAYENGDPGIVYIDRINRDNPTPAVGEIESTNPCGEQPLLPYESCNLGSINLAKMIKAHDIDYEKLRKTVHMAIHFLDNVIDVNRYPIPQIANMTKNNRKIGLGIMGFADLLIHLGIAYNSETAVETAESIMKFIRTEAMKKSGELAKVRGAFPNFVGSIYNQTGAQQMRNATLTTIAPTGTLSIIADCSSGVEPLFAICFVRQVMDDDKLLSVHPEFETIARKRGFYSAELMEKIAREGSIQKFDEVPEDIKKIFVTSHDIEPQWHIRMQAAFQKYTDNAVSKTVNFPHEATEDDVKSVYLMAYRYGCKGVTIYRDGSREVQVLNKGNALTCSDQVPAKTEAAPLPRKLKRPEILSGKTIKMNTGCGSLYVTVNENQGELFELFNTMGKAGGCAASQSEAIGRLVSLAWRSRISPEKIIKELRGISCHKPCGFGENKNLSCADAISNAIRKYMHLEMESESDLVERGGACPECGGPIEHESGCAVCRTCGRSECG